LASDTAIITSPPGDVLHPGSRAVFRHWEAIRGEAPAAHRDDLNLRQLGQFVSWLFIMERSPRSNGYIWRLAGSKLCDLWRRELTGSEVFMGWDRFERETVQRLLDGVTKNFQPCSMRLRLTTSLGQLIDTEIVALPLQARDGQSVHIFGAAMPFREASTLGYDRITAVELASGRSIWTEPIPGARGSAASEHMSRRNHAPLRLVSGGQD